MNETTDHSQIQKNIKANQIPDDLKKLKQWVCWQFKETDKGITKLPKRAWTQQANASTTDSKSWTTFSTAFKYFNDKDHHDGVGFVFTKDDPFCGIDLDNCRDPETGQVQPWAIRILKALDSYSEVSQSGKGVHIIVKAKLPGVGRKKLLPGTDHEVEMYHKDRYFCTTGDKLENYPAEIQERQDVVLKLYHALKQPAAKKKAAKTTQPVSPAMSDEDVIRLASAARNGEKFKQLMDGIHEYPSESEGDGALAAMLGFYTQDYDQILRIIQQSGLWDDKWERESYQQSTINGALAILTEHYHPPKAKKAAPQTSEDGPGQETEHTQDEAAEAYKEAINQIRRETKGSAGARKYQISQLVLNVLTQQGEFIKAQDALYYFHRTGRRVMPLTSMDFTALLNNYFGLVSSEVDFKYTLADLSAKCHGNGREAVVYIYAHYDTDTFKLYVDRFDGNMYRLDGDQIDLIPNGEDGVIFRSSSSSQPYKISEWDEGDHLQNHIIIQINVDPEGKPSTYEDYQQLIRMWIHALFFEELAPTKTLLLFTGVKGSGKTVAARLIGRLLFGSNFDVSTIGEERDYVANVTNNYLLCLDNADAYKKWLEERLATTATGGKHVFRTLYTTNEMEEHYSRCFLMLTSRTPKFKRDDVVERLLIIPMSRPTGFKSEGSMMRELAKYRNLILSEIFHTLNTYVKRIKGQPDQVYEGAFRMADFAEFGAKVLDDENKEWFMTILGQMSEQQTDFLLEDDPFVEVLVLWTDDILNADRWITANGLHKELTDLAELKRISFPYKNPKAISAKLRHLRADLSQVLSIEKTKRTSTVSEYKFGVK